MGQQQLLLVILVTIIVGIATVVAINTFGQAADSAAADAVRQDLATIAASAQGYFMKPTMLGGGGREFTGITFRDIAFGGELAQGQDVEDDEAFNENGYYEIGTVGADSFTVIAWIGASEPGDTTEDENVIAARICPDNMALSNLGTVTPPTNCD